MKKLIIILLLASGTFINVQAQQIPLYSQYYLNPFMYNPAMAGASNSGNIFIIDRSQWTGIPGAPVTRALTIDGPLNSNKVGLGFSVSDDETDIFDRISVYGSYAYNIKLNSQSNLRLGISGGFLQNRIDFSNIVAKDPGDKLILTQTESRSTFDGTFGAAYLNKDLSIGVAVPQLLAPRLQYMTNSNLVVYYSLARHVIGTVNYTFHLADDVWKLQPLVFTQFATGSPLVLNAGANLRYKDLAWFGLMWEKDFAVSVSAGIKIHKRIAIGYAYDMMTTAISTFAGTTQELSICYSFGKGDNHDEELQDRLKKLNDKVETDDKQHRVVEDSLRRQINTMSNQSNKKDSIIRVQQHNFEDFKRDMLDSLGRLRSGMKSTTMVVPRVENQPVAMNRNEEPTSYELNNIHFNNKDTKLSPSSYAQLKELAATLKKNPSMKIEVDGFCDYRGSDESNMKMSEERAISVQKYLVKQGVKKSQVEARGFGRTMPVADNKTEEGMRKNRRVEFKVLER